MGHDLGGSEQQVLFKEEESVNPLSAQNIFVEVHHGTNKRDFLRFKKTAVNVH